MVSLKAIFERYKIFCLLVSLFILGGTVQSFAATIRDDIEIKWVCMVGETKCCVNGTKSCCEDNGTLYDTSRCDDSCGLSGRKEYKYTASGCSYTTSTRTCCYNGEWSAWDGVCPTAPKSCSSSTKPESERSCLGGSQTRTVTCNTSTGTWTTGNWGSCDCSDPDYEQVTTLGGGTCCQRKDGTGLRCATDGSEVGLTWQKAGTNCRSKVECGFGSCSGSCSMSGSECTTWVNNGMSAVAQGCAHYDTGDRGICQAYICR